MTSTTLKQTAERILEQFTQAERTNGQRYYMVKEDAPEKEQITEYIYQAHDGMMPDDWKYAFFFEAIQMYSENEDADEVFPEADVYTSDLTAWLHSHNGRMYYLTQALEDYGCKDAFQAMAMAQIIEKQEVYDVVRTMLEEMTEQE